MTLTQTELTPILAIAAGILILLIPRLLSYIIAIYLIYSGFMQLNAAHHWIRFGLLMPEPAIVRVQAQANPQDRLQDRVQDRLLEPMLAVGLGYRRPTVHDRVTDARVTQSV